MATTAKTAPQAAPKAKSAAKRKARAGRPSAAAKRPAAKKTAAPKSSPRKARKASASKSTKARKPSAAAGRGRSAKGAGSASAGKSGATRSAMHGSSANNGSANNGSANNYSDKTLWQTGHRELKADRPMMKTLLAEHRHIASVMHLFSEQLDSIEAGELIDPHLVYEIMDYMVTWPDRFHHPREDIIYSRVAELDPGAVDEVDTLQRDHDYTATLGNDLLKAIESWRRGDIQGAELLKLGRAYVAHMYDHMKVEEQLVFPHIEAVLTPQDWRELEAEDQLAGVSAPVFGPRIQREFRNVARKLRRSLRRTVEHGALAEWIGIEAFMESLDALSLALDSSRHTAGMHLRDAVKEAADIVVDNPLTAPWHLALNNARVGLDLAGDVAEISRETLLDLAKINRARKDRARLLEREASRR